MRSVLHRGLFHHLLLGLPIVILSLSLLASSRELVVLVSDNYADRAVASLLGIKRNVTVPWGVYQPLNPENIYCRGDSIEKIYVIGGPAAVKGEYAEEFHWDETLCEYCRTSCVGEGEEEECDTTCWTESKGLYCHGSLPGNCWLERREIPWERIGGADRRYTSLEVFERFGKEKAVVTDGFCEAAVEKGMEEVRRLEEERSIWSFLPWYSREGKYGLIYEWPDALAHFYGDEEFQERARYSPIMLNLSYIGSKNVYATEIEPSCY